MWLRPALFAAVPALAGPWLMLFKSVEFGIPVTAIPIAVTGGLMGMQFYPLRLLTKPTPRQLGAYNRAWRSMVLPASIVTGAVTLSAIAAVSLGLATGTARAEDFLVVIGVLLIAVVGVLCGVIASLLTVQPIAQLITQGIRAVRRVGVDRLSISGSILLLSTVALATCTAIAIPDSGLRAGFDPRDIAVLLFLTPATASADGVALQCARVALIAVMASLVWILLTQPKRRSH